MSAYSEGPFGRALLRARGTYWSVVGKTRWSGRMTFVLNYPTLEDARAAVRELRRDHGGDERWSNPKGPYCGEDA